MNLNKIIEVLDLTSVDRDELAATNARRGFLKNAGNKSLKTLLAMLPLTFLPKIVKAQTGTVVDTLKFALLLEYLERDFYKMGLDAGGLIPSTDHAIFMQIYKHEAAHVEFLKSALGSAAGEIPIFDFTAGGMFPSVFTDYATFLALSQSVEDTGVRAYKGQAGNLQESDEVLTAGLQIHSVEARHASVVRRLRGMRGDMMIKGWIVNNESNGAPEAIYAGEENVTHAGVDLNAIQSLGEYSMEAKTEAFDEPLTGDQVFAIVKPFVIKGT